MTQYPGFGHSIDTQRTTTSHINLQIYFLDFEHHYHDTSISIQYPETTIPTAARIDTPRVNFTNWYLISASLPPAESDTSRKLKRKMFQDAKVDTKRKRKDTAFNPTYTR